MDDIEIIARNLLDAESLLAEGWQLRYAHDRELAKLLTAKRNAGESAIREVLSEGYRALASHVREGRAEMNLSADRRLDEKSGFEGFFKELDLHSRLNLAREWASLTDPMPLELCLPQNGSEYTIAHFGNLYADSALSAFSQALGRTVTLSAEDYAAACEEVSDGNADFCILPIESAGDGVMNRFEQMIDRYSLFILMTCLVRLSDSSDEEDTGEWIRFALLSASPCRLKQASDRFHLRITPDGESLWELLLAAELLGAELLECRLSGGTATRSAGRSAIYRLTFRADEGCRAALLAYLELGYSGYILTGAYYQLADQPLDA